MFTEENRSGSAMKTLLVVTAAFGAHDRAIQRPCSHRMPLAQLLLMPSQAGRLVGTLATHKLAAAPALKAPFVAAEKMEPFMACAPCLVALPPVEPAISVLVASRLLSPPLRAKMTTEKMALPTNYPLESALSRHFIISRLPVRTPPTRALVLTAVARAGHYS